MPAADTIYAARFSGPETLVKGRANVITCPLYRSGAVVVPTTSGSTITIRRPDNTLLVDAQAVTVTGSVAQYTVSNSALADEPYREGYAVEWSLVVSGTTHRFRRAGMVCRSVLFPVITDADLIDRYADLADCLPAGVTTFQAKIDAAWADLCDRLRRQGSLPERILSAEDLRQAHLFATMVLVLEDAIVTETEQSRWGRLLQINAERAAAAFADIQVTYDRAEVGVGAVRRPVYAATVFGEWPGELEETSWEP